MDNYGDDTFAVTGLNPTLFALHFLVLLIMPEVFQREEFCEINDTQVNKSFKF